jgi:hypothetical protein
MSRSRKDVKLHPVDNMTIFGLSAVNYRASILKRILTIFKQRLKPRQKRKQIVERVQKLSASLSMHEFQAVSGHLKRGVEITRKSIAEWPTLLPTDSTEYVKDFHSGSSLKLLCDICYEDSSKTKMRSAKLHPTCHRCRDLCEACLSDYFNYFLRDKEETWNEILCPTCDLVVSPHAIRPYLGKNTLAE